MRQKSSKKYAEDFGSFTYSFYKYFYTTNFTKKMLELMINTLLYLCTAIYFCKREKALTINSLIFFYYTLFSVFGYLVYNTEYYMWESHIRNKMSIFPLLFLFACFIIYHNSIKQINTKKIKRIRGINKGAENILYYSNILLMLLIIVEYKNAAFSTVDYAEAYEASVSSIKGTFLGKLSIYLLILNTGATAIQILLPWYLLAQRKKKQTIKAIFFLVVFFVSGYIKGAAIGSRGVLFFTFVNIGFTLFLFKPFLSSKVYKWIFITGSYVLFLFGSIAIAISIDRFGDIFIYRIASYFGEPFINFPQIFWNFPEHLNGEYIISQFRGLPAPNSKVELFYFKTMPGSLYIDFGIGGSILFLTIYSYILKKIIGRVSYEGTISLHQLLIYIYVYLGMIFSIFGFDVYGWSGYTLLFLFYIFLRKNETNTYCEKKASI